MRDLTYGHEESLSISQYERLSKKEEVRGHSKRFYASKKIKMQRNNDQNTKLKQKRLSYIQECI